MEVYIQKSYKSFKPFINAVIKAVEKVITGKGYVYDFLSTVPREARYRGKSLIELLEEKGEISYAEDWETMICGIDADIYSHIYVYREERKRRTR